MFFKLSREKTKLICIFYFYGFSSVKKLRKKPYFSELIKVLE